MKIILVLMTFLNFTSAFAIDVKVKFKVDSKTPLSSRMSCQGRSCACPDDTILDEASMRCLKCEGNLVLNSSNRCVDADVKIEDTLRDVRALESSTIELLKSKDSITPKTCDVSTMENGKFKNCSCESEAVSIKLSSGRDVSLIIKRSFNSESQRCERRDPYSVMVKNISCYGPREAAFRSIQKLNLVRYFYESPDFSLGSCGVTDGVHNFTVKTDENMLSILDAIFVSAELSMNRKIETFEIVPQSLNY